MPGWAGRPQVRGGVVALPVLAHAAHPVAAAAKRRRRGRARARRWAEVAFGRCFARLRQQGAIGAAAEARLQAAVAAHLRWRLLRVMADGSARLRAEVDRAALRRAGWPRGWRQCPGGPGGG
ncbi:MAG: hypothetical protein ACPGUV_02800 [Polyangiales bacterium]